MRPSRSTIACAVLLAIVGAAGAWPSWPRGERPHAYVGAHVSLEGGRERFALTSPSAVDTGSFGLGRAFDAFKGTGSYALGLQAGYDRPVGRRTVAGVEADLDAPSLVAGARALVDPVRGPEVFSETVLLAGTARGRLGRRAGDGLVYGTAGLAWSYDQLTRAAGDSAKLLRTGLALGAGYETPVTTSWTARLEYLHTDLGHRGATFPSQQALADLSFDSVRIGLNYLFDGDAISELPTALDGARFAFHGQSTLTTQWALPFHSPYKGTNSLDPDTVRETLDVTFYAGWRPWKGGELWIDPEIDQGFGLNGTFGVAGFTSAEAYKVGAAFPYARFPRYFLRQTVDLGGSKKKVEADLNQLPGEQTDDRLVITLGKFASNDVFDSNRLAHDPRGDFLNWAVVDTGTLDYAADAWAFTYGAALEWYTSGWAFRGGFFDFPVVPNSTDLDPTFAQHQFLGEVEHRHTLHGRQGRIAVTGFLSHGRMARFDEALSLAAANGTTPDVAAVRSFRNRTGLALNLDQQLSRDVGAFLRAGASDGSIESFCFTDVDRTFSVGAQIAGTGWGRPKDSVGVAALVNEISGIHQAYFAAGGLGVLVGDGQLPHPGAERILETYYARPFKDVRVTLDHQLVENPGYNRDRGPVSVLAVRLHSQF